MITVAAAFLEIRIATRWTTAFSSINGIKFTRVKSRQQILSCFYARILKIAIVRACARLALSAHIRDGSRILSQVAAKMPAP